MSRQKEPESLSEYKHRKLELIQMKDHHKQQVRYHRAQASAIQQQMEELDQKHEGYLTTARRQKSLENKRSIQEVADYLARDQAQIKKRIEDRKATKMLEHLMRGFK